jgi:hypothetical protein
LKHDRLTEEITETAALFSLGALCQHEARAFAEHLAEGCEVCELELKSFDVVAASIGTSDLAAPPTYIRDLLTARIQREPQGSMKPAAPGAIPFNKTIKEAPAREAPGTSRLVSTALPWAIAASFLIAFVVTYRFWSGDRDAILIEAKNQIDAALRDRDKWKEEAGQAKELAAINEVLSTPGSRTIALAGQQPAPTASGKIYWDVNSNRWVVSATLPPAPPGKVYQLWFVTAEAKISAGLIKPNAEGHGFLVVPFPSNITKLSAAAITLEPEGGSTQPTLPLYALGTAG